MRVLRLIIALGFLSVLPAPAISISIDYVNSNDNFFTTEAKSTLAKAASDVSYAITTTLTALSQNVYTGTNGGSSATADWSRSYTSPVDGSTVTQNTFSFAADELIIKVGSRALTGSTLGQGGPGGAGISLSGAVVSDGTFAGAVDNMEASSNASMVRGGPILGNFSGAFSGENYNLDYGYALGSLTFDNDGTAWNFSMNDPTTGQNDFYSVAVHEILHTLGVGTGATWTSNVSGTNWLGAKVIALLGSGADVIAADGSHIKDGLRGRAIIDGVITETMQDAAMTPSITTGTRKYLTELDLAFLSDMQWSVIPEPSHISLIAISCIALVFFRRR